MKTALILFFFALGFAAQAQWAVRESRPFLYYDCHVRGDSALTDSLQIIAGDELTQSIEIYKVQIGVTAPLDGCDSVRVGVSGLSAFPFDLGAMSVADMQDGGIYTMWTGERVIRVASDADTHRSVYAYFPGIDGGMNGALTIRIFYIPLYY